MHNEFTAVIEQGEDGWIVAFCPEIPEANGQGKTEKEALENLRDGIELVLEYRREEGLRDVPAGAIQPIVVDA